MKFRLEIANQSHKIDLVNNKLGKLQEIFIDDQKFDVSELDIPQNIKFTQEEGRVLFELNNEKFFVKLKELNGDDIEDDSSVKSNLDQMKEFFIDGTLLAPMPGKIVDIRCAKGDVITKGRFLLSLEAMKMENEILSPFDIKINEVLVSVNDSASDKQILLKYELVNENN